MVTETDKAYMMAGAIPPSHMAEIQKNGTPYRGQTRRALEAENKRLREQLESKDAKTTTTAAKLTQRQQVSAEKRKSLNALADSIEARRKKKELDKAKRFGDELAFRREVNAAGKAQKLRERAADAEADAAEAKATGRAVKGDIQASGNVLEQYEAMEQGEERSKFYSMHKNQILRLIDNK